jgi:hypothetical protein
MVSMRSNETYVPSSIDDLTSSSIRALDWPTSRFPSTTTDAPNSSARPSLTHSGRSVPKRL